jgi:hypothetical protein
VNAPCSGRERAGVRCYDEACAEVSGGTQLCGGGELLSRPVEE